MQLLFFLVNFEIRQIDRLLFVLSPNPKNACSISERSPPPPSSASRALPPSASFPSSLLSLPLFPPWLRVARSGEERRRLEEELLPCSLHEPYTNLHSFWKITNLFPKWILDKFIIFKTSTKPIRTFARSGKWRICFPSEFQVNSLFSKPPRSLYETSLVLENGKWRMYFTSQF